MSGGSYDHLYVWYNDLYELVGRMHHLRNMSERLSTLPYARDAALETERIVAAIDRLETYVEARAEALAVVWRAVEWWDSNDGTEDGVKKALAEYRGEK
jgi:hypothetical protein